VSTEESFHDDFYAQEADLFRSPLFRAVRDRDAAFLQHATPANARVVSLGCGEGSLEIGLSGHVQEIIGIDVSAEAIELAASQAKAADATNVEFRHGDVLDIDVPADSVDTVWGPAFLHHLPPATVGATLARIHAWLRPGGILVTIDPSSRRIVRHLIGLVRPAYDHHHSPDERELDPDDVIDSVTAAGFHNVRVTWTDFLAGPLAWLGPRIPPWAARGVVKADSAVLAIPGIRRYASGFAVTAIA
jgi:SAM-dependent methyltransferase